MLTKDLFGLALHIRAPWYIDHLTFDEKGKRLDIHLDFTKGATFSYTEDGRTEENLPVHDTTRKKWRHLNFFEHECYLHARVPRVRLSNGSVRLVKAPWEGLAHGFTLLFEALLMQLMSAMPVRLVGKLTGVHDNKLWTVLERYTTSARAQEDFSTVTTIGMDETARARGHRYITLFVDLVSRRTLFATVGKGADTVAMFVKDLAQHGGLVSNIRQASMDMSRAFIKGVREYLPHAQITFDKFHILKIINEAVDEVRRNEAKSNDTLKHTRYVFLKNEVNLTKTQKEKLSELKLSKENLATMRAYNMRLSFQQIYATAQTTKEFEALLAKWYAWAVRSRLDPMQRAAKTIKEHWAGIVAWKDSNINNGVLEGNNSVLQAAKSKARGYRTDKNFISIAYLLTGKLDYSKVNHAYVAL
jgi:transposase